MDDPNPAAKVSGNRRIGLGHEELKWPLLISNRTWVPRASDVNVLLPVFFEVITTYRFFWLI